MNFVWVKVLPRTGVCRALLVFRKCPLLHTQIPGGLQQSQTHYLLLQGLCFPQAPSHSCFQWQRWVPHNDLCLKKLLLSCYGWNKTNKKKIIATRVNKASPTIRILKVLWSDSKSCKLGPLGYGNILKERVLSFAFWWQKNLGHCSSITSNPEEFSRERQGKAEKGVQAIKRLPQFLALSQWDNCWREINIYKKYWRKGKLRTESSPHPLSGLWYLIFFKGR